MKKHRCKFLAVLLALFGAILCPLSAFAENYGIVYEGGVDLSNSIVNVKSSINSLTPLIPGNGVTTTKNNATKWQKGYVRDSGLCREYYYAKISDSSSITESDNLRFTIMKGEYRTEVQIKSADTEDVTGAYTTVGIIPDSGYIYGGWQPYNTSECTDGDTVSGVSRLNGREESKLFINTVLKLYRGNETTPVTSDQLYFGITDIDATQSYKILNSGNEFQPGTSGNMFAMTDVVFQPTDSTLRNKFVASGNYIYSDYLRNTTPPDPYQINTDGVTNIYVKLNSDTQQEGLDIVYGFVNNAASGMEYYAKQYIVSYEAEQGGRITGKTSESVIGGENPTSSIATANQDYRFTYWTADKDITLENGETITAGRPILLDSQIKSVVVNENLTFTAHFTEASHTVTYEADTGGSIIGRTTEEVAEGDNPTGATADPDDNYRFTYWTADKDVTLENGKTITAGWIIFEEEMLNVIVTEDLTFTAHFEEIKYTVNYEADNGGSITGITNEQVVVNSNPTGSTATPDSTHRFTNWTVDKAVTLTEGKPVAAGGVISGDDITKVIVTENLTFTAHFEEIKYTVNYEADNGGSITGITNEQVVVNSNPTGSTATPDSTHRFTNWTANKDVTLENGDEITAGSPLTNEQIQNVVVTEDITFTAHFEEIKYTVNYEADEGGTITGITDEDVVSGNGPSGSKDSSDDGYEFLYWTADVDVILEDGTEIKAGNPITEEQIKQIIVDRDITFTSHYKKIPVTPDTGATTNNNITSVATVSTTGVLLTALFIYALPRLTHRKVWFKK
ncbi:InlB B-repeat-containing protein [Candidatus Saccharibacteria bacterium]|nr:InlB B-repeat-containing protein [Candidatus Saccharibacteria bacterium]